MRGPLDRPISDAEIAVVRAVLQQAAVGTISPELFATVSSLRVIGVCGCGCPSVSFGPQVPDAHPLADGTGTTPSGGAVGIIVFGTREAITELEVYDLGAGPYDFELPLPQSIRAWKQRD